MTKFILFARYACAILLVFGLFQSANGFAESKLEIELRARLAAAESERATALKEKAEAVARLNAATLRISVNTVRAADAHKDDKANAGTSAEINAAHDSLRAVADINAAAAAQAAAAAAVTAATAQAQLDAMRKSSERNSNQLLWAQLFGFLAIVAGFIYKAWTDARDRRWSLDDEARHRTHLLEKVSEVKQEAHAAYAEANSVNEKIAAIGLQTRDGSLLGKK